MILPRDLCFLFLFLLSLEMFLSFKMKYLTIWFNRAGGNWRRFSCGLGQILYEGQTTMGIFWEKCWVKHPLDEDKGSFQGRNIAFSWPWFFFFIKGISDCFLLLSISAPAQWFSCELSPITLFPMPNNLWGVLQLLWIYTYSTMWFNKAFYDV